MNEALPITSRHRTRPLGVLRSLRAGERCRGALVAVGEREFVLGVSVLLAQYLVVVQNGSQRRRLPLLRARQLAKRLNADGPIDPPHAWTLAEDVAERFAAA